MSFFDEADEPRTAPQRRRPAGSGRRPPSDRQAIQVRRAVAATAIVILVILVVLGVHSCQVSQRNSALRDYNNNVASLIQSSDQTGSQFFGVLSGAQGSGNAAGLQNHIDQLRMTAEDQLSKARGLSVPSEVASTQQNFVLTMQMRRDGIANIAQQIQPALANATSQDAINKIATEMARFYASDVVYKSYTLTRLAAALNSAGISVGGSNGQQMNSGQFLPDVRWLTASFVAKQLHVSFSTPGASNAPPAPGIHGHRLDSCSVGSTTLQAGASATTPASPPPTFTCQLTNDGQNPETNVTVKISVGGTSASGQTVVPQTTPGAQSTATITLNSSPPAGTYTVTATIEKVPGETVTTHNTQTYQITFQ